MAGCGDFILSRYCVDYPLFEDCVEKVEKGYTSKNERLDPFASPPEVS